MSKVELFEVILSNTRRNEPLTLTLTLTLTPTLTLIKVLPSMAKREILELIPADEQVNILHGVLLGF